MNKGCEAEPCPWTYDNYADCSDGLCSFTYYRIGRVPNEMKLQVELNGMNYTSDTLTFDYANARAHYNTANYDVNIGSDGLMTIQLSAKQNDNGWSNGLSAMFAAFFGSLFLTLVIEIIVAFILIRLWKLKSWKKLILSVLLANIISLPIVWLISIGLFTLLSLAALIIAEAFAFVFEAYFLFWLNKKELSLKKSFILSIAMNAASMIIGGFIVVVLLGMYSI